jgi:hypothetical protein
MDFAAIRLILRDIKPEHSPIYLMGKFCFRRQAPWQQRRKILLTLWTLAIGLLLGGISAAVIIFQNKRH